MHIEGFHEELSVREPDIGVGGMFIPMGGHLAEGSVLKISFVLPRSNYPIQVRAEVKYCLEGVGIGIEFVDLPEEARVAIEEELGSR
jgi:hypothetical protein